MGKVKESLFAFAWNLPKRVRVGISFSLGGGAAVWVNRFLGWKWEVSFLLGWILTISIYLFFLGIVVISADGPMTRQHVSKHEPNRLVLMVVTVLMSFFGISVVGVLLTAVGKHPLVHSHTLLGASAVAVLLAWLFLHTSFGMHYARLYYQGKDIHGRPFQTGARKGLSFPGTDQPSYMDFLYVAFTLALTYSMSDVDVESEVMRRNILVHSLVSFFFYSTVLAGLLNAVVTS